MTLNTNHPIYLGVSQDFFTRMQELNILDGDAKFTLSMGAAEEDAKAFDAVSKSRASRGFAGIGRVLASLFTTPVNQPIVTSKQTRGVVVKFNTAKLMQNYQVLAFDEDVRVSAEVIQSVMLYVEGYYDVVDIEQLEPGDLYA